VSLGPISGLALLFTSGLVPIRPIAGKSELGLGKPPSATGIDIVYAGVLYGLTPVVISATLGSICPPLPIPAAIPPRIAASAKPSLRLAGGTDRGVLSLLAAIVRAEPLPVPPRTLLDVLCAVAGLLNRELDDPEPPIVLE
jgi:hypothetical protein